MFKKVTIETNTELGPVELIESNFSQTLKKLYLKAIEIASQPWEVYLLAGIVGIGVMWTVISIRSSAPTPKVPGPTSNYSLHKSDVAETTEEEPVIANLKLKVGHEVELGYNLYLYYWENTNEDAIYLNEGQITALASGEAVITGSKYGKPDQYIWKITVVDPVEGASDSLGEALVNVNQAIDALDDAFTWATPHFDGIEDQILDLERTIKSLREKIGLDKSEQSEKPK
ncbi:MAG: hypothetical protein FWG02_11385 [Holophagaceae bacterium]|nr:hypothetical protein [Holophagaceae bacterium]